MNSFWVFVAYSRSKVLSFILVRNRLGGSYQCSMIEFDDVIWFFQDAWF